MRTGKGQVLELILESGFRHVRIACAVDMIPSPGQYLLAGIASHADPLPVPLYSTESTPQGFTACAPISDTWTPGTDITLRGPFGRGFVLPSLARKVVLVQFDGTPSRILGLIQPSLDQGADVVIVSDSNGERLPDEVEMHPLSALEEILGWGDYIAFDVLREKLSDLMERLGGMKQILARKEAQILIQTPVPCGGVAECGVCAVNFGSNWKMACREGPVFDLRDL